MAAFATLEAPPSHFQGTMYTTISFPVPLSFAELASGIALMLGERQWGNQEILSHLDGCWRDLFMQLLSKYPGKKSRALLLSEIHVLKVSSCYSNTVQMHCLDVVDDIKDVTL